MGWIHSLGVCHRDLKLENVLLHPQAGTHGLVKLADFGMSKDFSQSMVETRTRIGTLAYLSPELFDEQSLPEGGGASGSYQPQPVDTWAMGVMLYVMSCGDYPFGTDQIYSQQKQRWMADGRARMDCVRNILSGRFKESSAWAKLTPPLQSLIRSCLTVNPAHRIRVDAILAHPWLAQHAGSDLQAMAAAAATSASARAERDWASFWPSSESLERDSDSTSPGMIPGASFDFPPMGSAIGSPCADFPDLHHLISMESLPTLDSEGGLPFLASAGSSGGVAMEGAADFEM